MLPSFDRFQRPDAFPAVIYFLVALCLALPGAWAGGCGGSSPNPATSQVSTESRDNTDIPARTGTTAAARVIFHAADGHNAELMVEVARTGPEKARGLMEREELDAESGMIFIWESPVQGGFWMKDTYIPLSIAFISEAGAVVDIQDMQALDLASHIPSAKYIYAVEANQGWFTKHGINVGDRAEFLER